MVMWHWNATATTPSNRKENSPPEPDGLCFASADPLDLALRELEGFTGFCLAVLLAFDDAAIAREEALLLQYTA